MILDLVNLIHLVSNLTDPNLTVPFGQGKHKQCESEKNKTVKEVLLNLLKESDAVEQQGFNITDQKKGITIINHYKEITKTKNKQANKQTIRYVAIQREVLKKFKDIKSFIENVGLSKSTLCFKI